VQYYYFVELVLSTYEGWELGKVKEFLVSKTTEVQSGKAMVIVKENYEPRPFPVSLHP